MKEIKEIRARARRRRQRNRRIALTICLMAVVMVASIGGTIAWLTDKTEAVKNTFTAGDINITLTETTKDYKMVPGNTISKDPKVTVEANSEACWLFVKVEKGNHFDTFMEYSMADGWTLLSDGVYYREVEATDADTSFDVIKDNKVTVKDTVTKAQLNDLTETTLPTLTFTAYAVQKDNVATAAEAWGKIAQ